MRLAIVGCRNCPPIDIGAYLSEIPEVIISGGARGVDTLARAFALENNIRLNEFLPEYKKLLLSDKNRKQ